MCAWRCGDLGDGGRARCRCTLRAVVVVVNKKTYQGLENASRALIVVVVVVLVAVASGRCGNGVLRKKKEWIVY